MLFVLLLSWLMAALEGAIYWLIPSLAFVFTRLLLRFTVSRFTDPTTRSAAQAVQGVAGICLLTSVALGLSAVVLEGASAASLLPAGMVLIAILIPVKVPPASLPT